MAGAVGTHARGTAVTSPSEVVVGFDPGPKRTAWAVVIHSNGACSYMDSGLVPSEHGEVRDLLSRLSAWGWVAPLRAAVEVPSGAIFQTFRASSLLETATVAGMVASECVSSLGPGRVVMVNAREARARLVTAKVPRKPGAMDRAVKAALGARVGSLPARTNAHVRDAIVASLWVAC